MTRVSVAMTVRDVEAYVDEALDSVLEQVGPDDEVVVVDDGSTDATPAILAELAAAHGWVTPLARPEADRSDRLADGRRKARDLDGFLYGARSLSGPADVVVKVDADVDFDSGFFEELIGRFAADETLGIASGTCFEQEDGAWVRRTKTEGSVWGATRAYREACLEDVMVMEPCMGWDGLDEIRAHLRGMRTQTFVDLGFRHHRPEGGRELSSLHQGEALGRASWYMGYRPSYLALRTLYRARREPAALAMLWGYAAAAARRAPRCPDERLVRELRERQRLGTTLRRGAPVS